MAIEVTLTLHGFDELNAKLAEFEDKVAKQIARTAVRKAMQPVLETAKQLCPVSVDGSHGNPPGFLRDSIHVKPKSKGRHVIGAAVTSGDEKGMFSGDAYYGGFIEYGTHKMAARPFLRPALDQNQQQVIALLSQELAAGILGRQSFEAGYEAGMSGTVGNGTSLTGKSKLAPPDWAHINRRKANRGPKTYVVRPGWFESHYAAEALSA